MSLCFLVCVKITERSHEKYIHRCVESIRRLYTTEQIVILTAPETTLDIECDANMSIVKNRYFSTLGAIYHFYEHRYADVACILHDSMVLVQDLPTPYPPIQFLYHFESPLFEHSLNVEGYRRILPTETDALLSTLRMGCFGNACILHHSVIDMLEILNIIPLIQTKYDFECMERIFAWKVQKAGLLTESLCGNIMNPLCDPWKNTQYSSMTLSQIQQLNFPYAILKSALARR